jgi:hypothetical protein
VRISAKAILSDSALMVAEGMTLNAVEMIEQSDTYGCAAAE